MTIKVLVVDDEPTICKGLRLTIPWAEMGAEMREAYDGEHALQIIREMPADLILTDVRMPRMNGLELVETLRNGNFPGKIVMLSGYDEFAYVKKAMQFGVKDYLLKPVDADELIGLLNKLFLEIAEEAERKTARKLEAYYRYIAKEMIENASRHEFPLTVPDPSSPCRFIVSRIGEYFRSMNEKPEPERNRLRSSWKESVDISFSQAGWPSVSLFLQQNILLTVIPQQEKASLAADEVSGIMEGCGRQERLAEHRLEWLASADAAPLSEMKPQAVRMIQLLHQGVKGLAALSPEQKEVPAHVLRPASADYPKALERRLLDVLFQHSEEEVLSTVRQLFEHFRERGYSLQEAYVVCEEMYTMVERRFRVTSGLNELSRRLPNLRAADLQIYDSFAALEHLFTQALAAACELLRQMNFGRNRWIIDWVKTYIGQNFTLELKSYELADKLRVTPNYFSSIFKRETGKSFHEYVNEVRIEKAKELLATTSELVGTIALAVGFKEYKYFSNIFKKHSGLVPSEYRDIHRRASSVRGTNRYEPREADMARPAP